MTQRSPELPTAPATAPATCNRNCHRNHNNYNSNCDVCCTAQPGLRSPKQLPTTQHQLPTPPYTPLHLTPHSTLHPTPPYTPLHPTPNPAPNPVPIGAIRAIPKLEIFKWQ